MKVPFKGVLRRWGSVKGFSKQIHIRRLGLLIGVAALIAIALSPNLLGRVPRYNVGDYHVGVYRAPFALTVTDEIATTEAQKRAVADVPPIFDFDPTIGEQAIRQTRLAFRRVQDLNQPLADLKNERISAREKARRLAEVEQTIRRQAARQRGEFEKLFGVELNDEEFNLLSNVDLSARIAERATGLLQTAYSRYITFDAAKARPAKETTGDPEKPLLLQLQTNGKTTTVSVAAAELVAPNQAEKLLAPEAAPENDDLSPEAAHLALKIALAQLKPNLLFAAAATEAARRAAAQTVLPVTYNFEKNQLIIGDGRQVTEQTIVVLDEIRRRTETRGWLVVALGLLLLVFATLFLSFWLSDANLDAFNITDRDVLMMSILLVATLFLFRLAGWFDDRLSLLFPRKPEMMLIFLFPLAAPAMIVRFLTRFEIGLIFSVVLTLLSVLAANVPAQSAALIFLLLLVGLHTMGHVKRRGEVWRGGLWVGLAAGVAALLSAVLKQDFSLGGLLGLPLAGILGGLLCSMLVLGVTPLFESAFDYLTDLSLLELANIEHPLLKQLSHHAPGTFHHSLAISSLAETAAEAIGANALLAHVGAMFHDVGKSLQPAYFVENQLGDNPHDQIQSPEESARILIAHVPAGVRLAKEHRLPPSLIDFIEQHHGTRTAAYFLAQARQRAAAGGAPADESVFRYPGPKPQTKETAILMLCDVIEARSRTLEKRTPEIVGGMVREMLDRIRAEGQLAESPLTESDQEKIVAALTGAIIGLRHERIAYPDQARHPREGTAG